MDFFGIGKNIQNLSGLGNIAKCNDVQVKTKVLGSANDESLCSQDSYQQHQIGQAGEARAQLFRSDRTLFVA